MIGIIVCGHGNFGTGISSALKLIAGLPENFECIDFEENDTVENLERKFKIALDKLKECTECLCFTDILGGSPFKVAVQISMSSENQKIVVIGGTNLGMLIEISMATSYIHNIDELADKALDIGKMNVVKFVYEHIEESIEDYSEGI